MLLKRLFRIVASSCACLLAAAQSFAQTPQTYFDQGQASMAAHNIDDAMYYFEQAVEAADDAGSTYQEALAMLAISRSFSLGQSADLVNLLEQLLINPVTDSSGDKIGASVYELEYDVGKMGYVYDDASEEFINTEYSGKKALSAYWGTDKMRSHAINYCLPQLIEAHNNLSRVSNPNFQLEALGTQFEIAGVTLTSPSVTLDYGDILTFKAIVDGLISGIYQTMNYETNAYPSHWMDMKNSGIFGLQGFFASSEKMFAVKNAQTSNYNSAKIFAQYALVSYMNAYDYIKGGGLKINGTTYNRTVSNPLFSYASTYWWGKQIVRTGASNLYLSFNDIRAVYYNSTQSINVNLAKFFSSSFNLNTCLPLFMGNTMGSGTFPDPTFGGVLPGMSNSSLETFWNSQISEYPIVQRTTRNLAYSDFIEESWIKLDSALIKVSATIDGKKAVFSAWPQTLKSPFYQQSNVPSVYLVNSGVIRYVGAAISRFIAIDLISDQYGITYANTQGGELRGDPNQTPFVYTGEISGQDFPNAIFWSSEPRLLYANDGSWNSSWMVNSSKSIYKNIAAGEDYSTSINVEKRASAANPIRNMGVSLYVNCKKGISPQTIVPSIKVNVPSESNAQTITLNSLSKLYSEDEDEDFYLLNYVGTFPSSYYGVYTLNFTPTQAITLSTVAVRTTLPMQLWSKQMLFTLAPTYLVSMDQDGNPMQGVDITKATILPSGEGIVFNAISKTDGKITWYAQNATTTNFQDTRYASRREICKSVYDYTDICVSTKNSYVFLGKTGSVMRVKIQKIADPAVSTTPSDVYSTIYTVNGNLVACSADGNSFVTYKASAPNKGLWYYSTTVGVPENLLTSFPLIDTDNLYIKLYGNSPVTFVTRIKDAVTGKTKIVYYEHGTTNKTLFASEPMEVQDSFYSALIGRQMMFYTKPRDMGFDNVMWNNIPRLFSFNVDSTVLPISAYFQKPYYFWGQLADISVYNAMVVAGDADVSTTIYSSLRALGSNILYYATLYPMFYGEATTPYDDMQYNVNRNSIKDTSVTSLRWSKPLYKQTFGWQDANAGYGFYDGSIPPDYYRGSMYVANISSDNLDGIASSQAPYAFNLFKGAGSFSAAPTSLIASKGSYSASGSSVNTGIKLTWTNPKDKKYAAILRSDKGSNISQAEFLSEFGGTGYYKFKAIDSYVDTKNIVPGKKYYYWVLSYNAPLITSSELSIMPYLKGPVMDLTGVSVSAVGYYSDSTAQLATPSNVIATTDSNLQVIVSWSPLAKALGYKVYRSTLSDMSDAVCLTLLDNGDEYWQGGTSFIDKTGDLGQVYYYAVKAAANNGGENASDFSASAMGYKAVKRLVAPADVAVVRDGDTIKITWVNKNTDTTVNYYYMVYRSTVKESQNAEPVTGWISNAYYDDTTALRGVTYYYYVVVALDVNGLAQSPFSAYKTSSSTTIPLEKPTGVAASSGSTDGITISWTAPKDATNYMVYRSPTNTKAGGTLLSATWIAGTSFTDTVAEAGKDWYYSVKAASSASGVNPSDYSAIVAGYKVLTAPTLTATEGTFSNKINLTWSNSAGAKTYRVYRTLTPVFADTAPIYDGASRAYSDTDVAINNVYYYFVKAVDAAGRTSAVSASAFGYVQMEIPQNVVAEIPAVGSADAKLKITWSASLNAQKYRIYRSTTNKSADALEIGTSTTNQFEDTTLERGIIYYYFVKAEDIAGIQQSGFSKSASGYINVAKPTGLTASSDSSAAVNLTWQPVENALVYKVYRAASGGDPVALSGWLKAVSGTQSYADKSKIEYSRNYTYYVSAASQSNGKGEGPKSDGAQGMKLYPAPTGVKATQGTSETSVTVTWNASNNVNQTVAEIYRSTSSSFPGGTPIATVTGSASYTDSLTTNPGVYIYYFVKWAGTEASGPSTAAIGFRKLSVPTGVSASADKVGFVEVKATLPAGSSYYKIYRSTTPTGAKTAITPSWVSASSLSITYSDEKAVPAQTYYYYVTAAGQIIKPTIESAYSVSASGVALIAPVDNLTVSEGQYSDKITLKWSNKTSAPFVKVWRAENVAMTGKIALTGSDFVKLSAYTDSSKATSNAPAFAKTYYYTIENSPDASGVAMNATSAASKGYLKINSPVSVAATTNESDIKITWQSGNTDGAPWQYKVYRSETNSPSSAAAVSSWLTDVTQYVDNSGASTPVAGKFYYYFVMAGKDGGTQTSALSTTQKTANMGSKKCATITGITATNNDYSDKVVVNWTSKDYSAYYMVYSSQTNSASSAKAISGWLKNASSFNDTKAEVSVKTYYWVVAALTTTGVSISDKNDPAIEGMRATPAPKSVTATKGTSTDSVVVTWVPSVATVSSHFKVYRGSSSDPAENTPSLISGAWTQGTSYSDTSAQPGQIYYYFVKLAADASGKSESAYGKTGAQGYLKLSAAAINASKGSSTEYVTISGASAEGANYYKVYRGTKTGTQGLSLLTPSWEKLRSVGGSITYYDTKAVPGTDYYYYVKLSASEAAGEPTCESDYSNETSGYMAITPAVVTATQGSSLDSIKVSWKNNKGATFSKLLRSETKDAAAAVQVYPPTDSGLQYIKATAFTDSSDTLKTGKPYYYYVVNATTADGHNNSGASDYALGYLKIDPPANVNASDDSDTVLPSNDTQIDVAWSPAMADETLYYKVWRMDVNKAPTSNEGAITDWISGSTYADARANLNGPAAGQQYYYFVKSGNSDGEVQSAYSKSGVGDMRFNKPIGTSITATKGESKDYVRITYTSIETNAKYYKVYRSTDPAGVQDNTLITPSWVYSATGALSFDDKKASQGVRYYYRLALAGNSKGLGESAQSDTTPTAAGSATGFRAFNSIAPKAADGINTDNVLVTWTKLSNENAKYYKVYRYLTSDVPDQVAADFESDWLEGASQYADTTAVPGTTYWYYVKAGTAADGDMTSLFGAADTGWRKMSPPTINNIQSNLPDYVTLTWTVAPGATFYRVYRGLTSNPASAAPISGWISSVFYEDREVSKYGVDGYYYFVKSSADNLGKRVSDLSAPAHAIPPTADDASAKSSASPIEGLADTSLKLYVVAGAAGNGTSWYDAYGDLQYAINAAALVATETDNVYIFLAEGLYTPTAASYTLPPYVQIVGGFAADGSTALEARNPSLYKAVLNGVIEYGDNDIVKTVNGASLSQIVDVYTK